jgi:predicted MFS family arabinose efflux permease
MITPFQIYLWGICDQVQFGATAMAFIFGAASIISSVVWCILFEDNEKQARNSASRVFILSAPLFALMMALIMFLPTSKTIACMYVIPAVANSTPIQKDIPEVYKMAIDKFKSELKTPSSK